MATRSQALLGAVMDGFIQTQVLVLVWHFGLRRWGFVEADNCMHGGMSTSNHFSGISVLSMRLCCIFGCAVFAVVLYMRLCCIYGCAVYAVVLYIRLCCIYGCAVFAVLMYMQLYCTCDGAVYLCICVSCTTQCGRCSTYLSNTLPFTVVNTYITLQRPLAEYNRQTAVTRFRVPNVAYVRPAGYCLGWKFQLEQGNIFYSVGVVTPARTVMAYSVLQRCSNSALFQCLLLTATTWIYINVYLVLVATSLSAS